MPDILVPVLALGTAAFVIWAVVTEARRTVQSWSEAARGAGAYQLRQRHYPNRSLHARVGDFELAIMLGNDSGTGGPVTWIHLQSYELAPIRLELRAERVKLPLQPQSFQGDVPTGDATFDAAVEIQGHPVLVSAILDEETRARVLRLINAGGQVVRGRVSKPVGGSAHSTSVLTDEIAALADLARALESPPMPWVRLARNSGEESLRGVRARNLELLTRHFAGREESRTAALAARNDPEEAVRVIAAVALVDEDPDLLIEIATSPTSSDHAAASAVRALGPRLDVELSLGLLNESLRNRRRAVALALIAALGEMGAEAAVDRLRTVVGVGDDELAAAALTALAASGGARAEAILINALDKRPRVQKAAIESLGEVGTTSAVPHLRRVADAGPRLRPAVNAAVLAIQARASGAAPGQLALSADQAGELALTGDDRVGALGLAPERKSDEPPDEGPGIRVREMTSC